MTFITSSNKSSVYNRIRNLILPGLSNDNDSISIALPDSVLDNTPWIDQVEEDLLELFPGADRMMDATFNKLLRALEFKVAGELILTIPRILRQEIEEQEEQYDRAPLSELRDSYLSQYQTIIEDLQPSLQVSTNFRAVSLGSY